MGKPRKVSLGSKRAKRVALATPQRKTSTERGYNNRWRKARATFLAREPLCRISVLSGRPVAAQVVDHLYPHCGLSEVFWETGLWLPVTKAWHDEVKQSIECRGEAALDDLAIRLGYDTLAMKRPELIDEWREAYAVWRLDRKGGWGQSLGRGAPKPPP